MELTADMSINLSTNSGETLIGSSPRSRHPVVMFLTFLVDDQRLDDDRCLWVEELLVEECLSFLEGTETSGGGFLIVCRYISRLLIWLGLNRLGFGLAGTKPARGTSLGIEFVVPLVDADGADELRGTALGDATEEFLGNWKSVEVEGAIFTELAIEEVGDLFELEFGADATDGCVVGVGISCISSKTSSQPSLPVTTYKHYY
jgi:hypothetical protein